MLVYLANRGEFLDTKNEEEVKKLSSIEKMKWAQSIKEKLTAKTLCIEKAKFLQPFVKEVFKIGFFDKPDYDSLIDILNQLATINGKVNKPRHTINLTAASSTGSYLDEIQTRYKTLISPQAKSIPKISTNYKDKVSALGSDASVEASDRNKVRQFPMRSRSQKRVTVDRVPISKRHAFQRDPSSDIRDSKEKNTSCGMGFFENLMDAFKFNK